MFQHKQALNQAAEVLNNMQGVLSYHDRLLPLMYKAYNVRMTQDSAKARALAHEFVAVYASVITLEASKEVGGNPFELVWRGVKSRVATKEKKPEIAQMTLETIETEGFIFKMIDEMVEGAMMAFGYNTAAIMGEQGPVPIKQPEENKVVEVPKVVDTK